jgi:hypothetical protein
LKSLWALNQRFRGIVCFQALNRLFVSRRFGSTLPRRKLRVFLYPDIISAISYKGNLFLVELRCLFPPKGLPNSVVGEPYQAQPIACIELFPLIAPIYA